MRRADADDEIRRGEAPRRAADEVSQDTVEARQWAQPIDKRILQNS